MLWTTTRGPRAAPGGCRRQGCKPCCVLCCGPPTTPPFAELLTRLLVRAWLRRDLVKQVWRPNEAAPAGAEMVFSNEAYNMYHAMTPDWPCLSFDIIPDRFGHDRSRVRVPQVSQRY